MARQIAGHLEEWTGPGSSGGPGRPLKYPWDEWLNGQVWQITYDDHPGTDSHLFRQYARRVAKKRGLKLRARQVGEGGKCDVQIQAIIP